MTPAQRAAMLEQAKNLMQQVEADETAAPPATATNAQLSAASQAVAAASTARTAATLSAFVPPAPTAASITPSVTVSAGTPAPANIATMAATQAKRGTPLEESTAAGKPSLLQTLLGVAAAGFKGKK